MYVGQLPSDNSVSLWYYPDSRGQPKWALNQLGEPFKTEGEKPDLNGIIHAMEKNYTSEIKDLIKERKAKPRRRGNAQTVTYGEILLELYNRQPTFPPGTAAWENTIAQKESTDSYHGKKRPAKTNSRPRNAKRTKASPKVALTAQQILDNWVTTEIKDAVADGDQAHKMAITDAFLEIYGVKLTDSQINHMNNEALHSPDLNPRDTINGAYIIDEYSPFFRPLLAKKKSPCVFSGIFGTEKISMPLHNSKEAAKSVKALSTSLQRTPVTPNAKLTGDDELWKPNTDDSLSDVGFRQPSTPQEASQGPPINSNLTPKSLNQTISQNSPHNKLSSDRPDDKQVAEPHDQPTIVASNSTQPTPCPHLQDSFPSTMSQANAERSSCNDPQNASPGIAASGQKESGAIKDHSVHATIFGSQVLDTSNSLGDMAMAGWEFADNWLNSMVRVELGQPSNAEEPAPGSAMDISPPLSHQDSIFIRNGALTAASSPSEASPAKKAHQTDLALQQARAANESQAGNTMLHHKPTLTQNGALTVASSQSDVSTGSAGPAMTTPQTDLASPLAREQGDGEDGNTKKPAAPASDNSADASKSLNLWSENLGNWNWGDVEAWNRLNLPFPES